MKTYNGEKEIIKSQIEKVDRQKNTALDMIDRTIRKIRAEIDKIKAELALFQDSLKDLLRRRENVEIKYFKELRKLHRRLRK